MSHAETTLKLVSLPERRFIEKPLKPAPYQPVTKTVIRSTPTIRPTVEQKKPVKQPSPPPLKSDAAKKAKKYGSKLDTTGSPSRSRSTTKELIRKFIINYIQPSIDQQRTKALLNTQQHQMTQQWDHHPSNSSLHLS